MRRHTTLELSLHPLAVAHTSAIHGIGVYVKSEILLGAQVLSVKKVY
jgi:hypothetical protein